MNMPTNLATSQRWRVLFVQPQIAEPASFGLPHGTACTVADFWAQRAPESEIGGGRVRV